jgi:hypothetical protein
LSSSTLVYKARTRIFSTKTIEQQKRVSSTLTFSLRNHPSPIAPYLVLSQKGISNGHSVRASSTTTGDRDISIAVPESA